MDTNPHNANAQLAAPAQLNTNDLALIRTTLALDRTLLAWVRTSLTLIGSGFTLARYINHLITTGSLHGVSNTYARNIGALLMLLGIATLVGGAVEYVSMVKKLHPHAKLWSISLIVTLVLALVSTVMIGDLLFEIIGH